MVSSGLSSLDGILGGDGYPDRSSILVVGPPGIGKEVLGYWFIRSGLVQGDYCLYATHRPVSDVLRDMKGVGIGTERVPEWISSSGSRVKCDLKDATSISFNLDSVGTDTRYLDSVRTDTRYLDLLKRLGLDQTSKPA